MPVKIHLKRLYKTSFFLCLIVITILSLMPQDAGRGLTLPRLTSSAFELHVLAYAVTMFMGMTAFRCHGVLALFLLAYGALLEAVQGMLPTRALNPFDILANAVGIALALLIYFYSQSRRRPRPTTDLSV